MGRGTLARIVCLFVCRWRATSGCKWCGWHQVTTHKTGRPHRAPRFSKPPPSATRPPLYYVALELSASDGVTEAVDCAVAVPLKRRAAASARLGLVNDVMLFSRTHTPHPQWSFASTTTAASWYARLARTLTPDARASGIRHPVIVSSRVFESTLL